MIYEKQDNKRKNIGIEIFRIFLMYNIVLFHFSNSWGAVPLTIDTPMSFNWFVLAVAYLGGGTGNCGFALISGYLLYNKSFNKKRVMRFWLEVWFYSVFCGTIAFLLHSTNFPLNKENIISMFFPVLTNQYWYMSTYIVIMLFSPFLNKMIASLDKEEYQRLLIIAFIVFSLIPSIFTSSRWMVGTNNIAIMFVMYLVGAYIHMFNMNGRYTIPVSFLLIIIGVGSIYIRKMLCKDPITWFVWETEKIIPVILSITLFLTFKNINVRLSEKMDKFITFFSSSVFAVYLLHIGRLREFVFLSWFNDSIAFQHWYFVIWLLVAASIIFLCCIIIDKVRLMIEEHLLKISFFNRFLCDFFK